MKKLSPEDRENIAEASKRHRLYLLAKNDYKRFEQLVGTDKAKDTLESLQKNHRYDSALCIRANKADIDSDELRDCLRALNDDILRDAARYIESPAFQTPLHCMKIHLAWALLTHAILLITAVYLCLEPWINGNTPLTINGSTATNIGVASIIILLSVGWFKYIIRGFMLIGKDWLYLIAASLLFIGASQYLINLSVDATDAVFWRGIGVSVVAIAHILLILDCIAGLSPRNYYFSVEGFIDWVKGWSKEGFALYRTFTPSLSNSYADKFCNYDDRYRSTERAALESEMREKSIYLGHKYGKLEFHPSRSINFIVSYILVDILHTVCILAWMVTLCHVLADGKFGLSILAAVISCAVIYVLLNRPLYGTNNFHTYICRNMYAYKVSHLFRKLAFSALLIAGIIALTCINYPPLHAQSGFPRIEINSNKTETT